MKELKYVSVNIAIVLFFIVIWVLRIYEANDNFELPRYAIFSKQEHVFKTNKQLPSVSYFGEYTPIQRELSYWQVNCFNQKYVEGILNFFVAGNGKVNNSLFFKEAFKEFSQNKIVCAAPLPLKNSKRYVGSYARNPKLITSTEFLYNEKENYFVHNDFKVIFPQVKINQQPGAKESVLARYCLINRKIAERVLLNKLMSICYANNVKVYNEVRAYYYFIPDVQFSLRFYSMVPIRTHWGTVINKPVAIVDMVLVSQNREKEIVRNDLFVTDVLKWNDREYVDLYCPGNGNSVQIIIRGVFAQLEKFHQQGRSKVFVLKKNRANFFQFANNGTYQFSIDDKDYKLSYENQVRKFPCNLAYFQLAHFVFDKK